MNRRAFLSSTAGALLPSPLRVALLTDVHYADKAPAGSRHYRDSLAKMRAAVQAFQSARAHLAIELGDFVDQAPDAPTEIAWLQTITAEFNRAAPRRHFVPGNHCLQTLSRAQFIQTTRARPTPYAFSSKGWRFILLDACHRADLVAYNQGNFTWTDAEIPPAQQRWLKDELARDSTPAVVCLHQRLDVEGHYAVHSAAAVRALLEASPRVQLVLQGHAHKPDDRTINGVRYATLAGMIEGPGLDSNAYAILDLHPNGAFELHGSGRQPSIPPTERRTG